MKRYMSGDVMHRMSTYCLLCLSFGNSNLAGDVGNITQDTARLGNLLVSYLSRNHFVFILNERGAGDLGGETSAPCSGDVSGTE